ncbi:hypothetical protein D3C86_1447180 [compost metagenome]
MRVALCLERSGLHVVQAQRPAEEGVEHLVLDGIAAASRRGILADRDHEHGLEFARGDLPEGFKHADGTVLVHLLVGPQIGARHIDDQRSREWARNARMLMADQARVDAPLLVGWQEAQASFLQHRPDRLVGQLFG